MTEHNTVTNIGADAYGRGFVDVRQDARCSDIEAARVVARAALVDFWQQRQGAPVANVYAEPVAVAKPDDGAAVTIAFRETDTPPAFTVARFAAEAAAELRPTYELVYVDRGDHLDDKQVTMLLSGDLEGFDESTAEWAADNAWHGAEYEAKELTDTLLRRWEAEAEDAGTELDADDFRTEWEASTEYYELREDICGREDGAWLQQLANATPDVLLRIRANEDDYDGELWSKDDDDPDAATPESFLTAAGFPLPARAEDISTAAEILANADTYGTIYYLVAAPVAELLQLRDGDRVTFYDPHVLLSNPYAGNGYAEQIHGAVTVPASALETDRGAFGYGWQEITGGIYVSAYSAEMTVTHADPDDTAAAR